MADETTTMPRFDPDSDSDTRPAAPPALSAPPAPPARPEPRAALDRWLAAERAAPPGEALSGGEGGQALREEAGRALYAAARGAGIAPVAGLADPADSADLADSFDAADPADPADHALAALLAAALPSAAPPAGFAGRVMSRLASLEPAPLPRPMAARRRRLAWQLGAGLAAASCAVLALSWTLWLPPLMRLLSPAHLALLLQGASDAVLGAARAAAEALSVGNTLLLVARAVARPLTTPPVAALAALSLLISFLALRFLHALIQRDRRWVYAGPI